MDTNAEPGNGAESGAERMSENGAGNTPDGQHEPPGYPPTPAGHVTEIPDGPASGQADGAPDGPASGQADGAPTGPASGQTYGIYPPPGEGTQEGLQIMQPRSADTAVLEYGRPGDPLLVPNRLVGLDARNVSAWFGSHKVLERVSLAMEPGTVTALIGPSGCGKSTFLRMLNRMNELIEGTRHVGSILLDGEEVYGRHVNLAQLPRRLGMVFQKSNPFPKSVFENVVFGPRVAGVKDNARLAELTERCLKQAALWDEIKDRLHDSALNLSGGQQQRLCIARALAVEPEVLLMDEPASALDPTATARIEELVLALKASYTIVVVTHNMQQAARISDRTAFMLSGKLIERGETRELFTRPKEKLTEDYITGRFG